MPRIYFDHHATTPTDPRVLEAMLPWFGERPGNPESPHEFGWAAREAVQDAAAAVARLVGGEPDHVVFTGSATESIDLALSGLAEWSGRGHFVTTNVEHPAVSRTLERLAGRGFELTVVPVGPDGRVDPDGIADALRDDTLACSVMLANNEVGTIQPLAEIGRRCASRGVLLHSDACQAVGRIPVDLERMGIDLLSLSGHKFYAPMGIGALVIRRRRPRIRLMPRLVGGGQQRGLRSGTVATPLAVGLGVAADLAAREMEREAERLAGLRDRLWAHFRDQLSEVFVNGSLEERLPGNLSVTMTGVEAEAVLRELPGLGLSAGSACSAASQGPSHVLLALGRTPEQAHATLRFGLGRTNTAEQVDEVAAAVIDVVRRLRQETPTHEVFRPKGDGSPAKNPLGDRPR